MINDDEWLARLRELIGDDDCVLGGNLVRMPNEDSDFSDTIRPFQMNDDEWLMRQLELEGDDDCVLGGNLVRTQDDASELIDSTQQTVCEFPIEVFNEQDFMQIDEAKIKFICRKIVSDAGIRTGRLGIVLANNATTHALNSKYLGHDFVTDCISFNLDCTSSLLKGEVVVSAELAKERCEEFGWDDESELLLYVIHGTLHQVGYDDQTEYDAQLMRQKEAFYLHILGILLPHEDETLRSRYPNWNHHLHVPNFQFLSRHP